MKKEISRYGVDNTGFFNQWLYDSRGVKFRPIAQVNGRIVIDNPELLRERMLMRERRVDTSHNPRPINWRDGRGYR